jgi:hypothetical protein
MAISFADFEEREFETPLYHQLRVGNNKLWSPGQVLENRVGFDYSALCTDSFFWAIHNLRVGPTGFFLEEMFMRHHWQRAQIRRPLPDFSLNLFLQAKRPRVRTRVSKLLKDQDISAPYLSMMIEKEQQSVLELLSIASKGKALVCYATPAFHRVTQLYSHITNGTIVQNSSFPEAIWLQNHSAWHYDKPGASGIANADPKAIVGEDLFERIDRLVDEPLFQENVGYEKNLGILVQMLFSISESSGNVSLVRFTYFRLKVGEIEALLEERTFPRYREAVKNFLIVLAFTESFNLQWHVIGA